MEADWIGKTPEEWRKKETGETEYTIKYTITGEVTVYAHDYEDAVEKVRDMSISELTDDFDDIEYE